MITVPRMAASADTAKRNACETNIELINTQIDIYKANSGSIPTLATLFADTNYFPDGDPVCPYSTAYIQGPKGYVMPHVHK
jgi:competence protein ComGC